MVNPVILLSLIYSVWIHVLVFPPSAPPYLISKLTIDTLPVAIEPYFRFSPVSAHLARSVNPLNTFFELSMSWHVP